MSLNSINYDNLPLRFCKKKNAEEHNDGIRINLAIELLTKHQQFDTNNYIY